MKTGSLSSHLVFFLGQVAVIFHFTMLFIIILLLFLSWMFLRFIFERLEAKAFPLD
jgi:flagellar biogenesis protein FliO